MERQPPEAVWLRVKPAGELVLMISVQPGAKKSAVIGLYGERLKVKVAAPPVDGAANKALIKFLAEQLSLKKQDIILEAGETSRKKAICLLAVNEHGLAILANWASTFKK